MVPAPVRGPETAETGARVSLTYKDVTEILRIIDESDVEELILEVGDSKIVVRRHAAGGSRHTATVSAPPPTPDTPPPAAPAGPAAESPSEQPETAPADGAQVRAPMVGTFYRRPAPQEPPYVEIGDTVRQGDPICIIEVMKLFTTIEAPVSGKIVAIAAENEDLVQLDQLLFVIAPG